MVAVVPGYSLRTSSSILSPVQMMILGLSIPASGNGGLESQRTVMAAVIHAVSRLPCCAVVAGFTFRLTIRT